MTMTVWQVWGGGLVLNYAFTGVNAGTVQFYRNVGAAMLISRCKIPIVPQALYGTRGQWKAGVIAAIGTMLVFENAHPFGELGNPVRKVAFEWTGIAPPKRQDWTTWFTTR